MQIAKGLIKKQEDFFPTTNNGQDNKFARENKLNKKLKKQKKKTGKKIKSRR